VTAGFSASLVGVLRVLAGAGPGYLQMDARTLSGIGQEQIIANAAEVHDGWLPAPLVRLLESRDDWHVRVRPMVTRNHGSGASRLGVVFARWQAGRSGGAITAAAANDAFKSLAGFGLAPSIVLDATREIVAMWRLDRAVDCRTPAAVAAVKDLQLRLAKKLGASVETLAMSPNFEAHDPDGDLPLCGVVREIRGYNPPVIEMLTVDPSYSYALDTIEGAIQENRS